MPIFTDDSVEVAAVPKLLKKMATSGAIEAVVAAMIEHTQHRSLQVILHRGPSQSIQEQSWYLSNAEHSFGGAGGWLLGAGRTGARQH